MNVCMYACKNISYCVNNPPLQLSQYHIIQLITITEIEKSFSMLMSTMIFPSVKRMIFITL